MRSLALLVLLVACERERRESMPASPSAQPLTSAANGSLYAGPVPIGGVPLEPDLPGYSETAEAVANGQTLYQMYNCSGCHAHAGGGGMGPALRDAAWRYGSTPRDIAVSIIAGRPDGMPSYRGKLAASQLQPLIAYVRMLGGFVPLDRRFSRTDHMQVGPAPTLRDQ